MRLKRVQLNVTIKADRVYRGGTYFLAPDIPKSIVQELSRRPHLFVCEYEDDPVVSIPPPQALAFDIPKDDSETLDSSAFVKEWKRKREYTPQHPKSFYQYVVRNKNRFIKYIENDPDVREIALRKWEKFYPDAEFIL